MSQLLFVVAAGTLVLAQAPAIHSQSSFQPPVKSDVVSADVGDIPPFPRGTTTIFGGAIRDLDPVRDQFTLHVIGQRPTHILFDERTQVFRDGSKIRLRDLGPEEHASVETTLDGDKVFAVSIHILSQPAEGQYDGRVVSYNPTTGALAIDASASRDPLRVFVSADTRFSRAGQSQFTSVASGSGDLAPGSLVSIKFHSRGPGQAVASAITVLAVPGSSFTFSGNVISIDFHSGLLVLTDPIDHRSCQISFSSALFPQSRNLHPGDHVMVTAAFNGTGFVASMLAPN
ncbi:MAG: hypothetical protein WAL75_02825 [Terracidiphilus sp.]